MASISEDLPAPVGPVIANRSSCSKSTTVRWRKAVKPSMSSLSGLTALLFQQLAEQAQHWRLGHLPPAQRRAIEGRKQLLRSQPGQRFPPLLARAGSVPDHVDRVGQRVAHLG